MSRVIEAHRLSRTRRARQPQGGRDRCRPAHETTSTETSDHDDAPTVADAADYREAFRRFARARRRHLRYYAWVTFILTPFFQSDGFIKGVGRDIALPIMTHLPWVRGQMLLTMAGFKGGFFAGKMEI